MLLTVTAGQCIVLIVDDVQHAITTEDGNNLLLGLKAAQQSVAINPRPATLGHFLFIGTGSHSALVAELTARRNQAFAGATSIEFPLLAADYVEHLFERLAADGGAVLPSSQVAVDTFKMLGNRPEEMIKALRQLQHIAPASDPDELFPVIAATLRSAAADIELAKVEQLGCLAAWQWPFSSASRQLTATVLACSPTAPQQITQRPSGAKCRPRKSSRSSTNQGRQHMRRAHGRYGVTDPHIKQLSRERLEG